MNEWKNVLLRKNNELVVRRRRRAKELEMKVINANTVLV